MMEPSSSPARPALGQWLVVVGMACWLASVPLTVMAALSSIAGHPPDLLVELGAVPPGDPALPEWAFGPLQMNSTSAPAG